MTCLSSCFILYVTNICAGFLGAGMNLLLREAFCTAKEVPMNTYLFEQAINSVVNSPRTENGIGTLGEKTVHAVLKNYLAPDQLCHEKKIGSFYADIVTPEGIIEIQTQNFDRLRKKLPVFLEKSPVTVVYPIAHTKWLRWVDKESGEVSPKRKSPKTGKASQILPELYKIKDYLFRDNLTLHLLFIDLEEYKFLNGWSLDKKKGAEKADRIPVGLKGELLLRDPADFQQLVPEGLSNTFVAKEFAKASGFRGIALSSALKVLLQAGVIEQTGKKGRAFLYTRKALPLI